MGTRLVWLFTGETTRMRKYGISAASLATAVLWILLMEFGRLKDIGFVLPLILFVDSTIMSLLLAGVTMVFEAQENTLGSMLVTPISKDEYLIAKSLAVTSCSLSVLICLLIYGMVFKGLSISIPGVVGAVILIAFAFSQVGMIITYYAKDFTDLLMGMFKLVLIFSLPTILESFQIISGPRVRNIQYLNPTKNALVLLQATVMNVGRRDLAIAIGYLLILTVVLYYVSRQLFDEYAAQKGGV